MEDDLQDDVPPEFAQARERDNPDFPEEAVIRKPVEEFAPDEPAPPPRPVLPEKPEGAQKPPPVEPQTQELRQARVTQRARTQRDLRRQRIDKPPLPKHFEFTGAPITAGRHNDEYDFELPKQVQQQIQAEGFVAPGAQPLQSWETAPRPAEMQQAGGADTTEKLREMSQKLDQIDETCKKLLEMMEAMQRDGVPALFGD